MGPHMVHGDPIVADSGPLLAPNELPAPTAILSPAKRDALIACLNSDGTLHKRHGAWVAESRRQRKANLRNDGCRPWPRRNVDAHRASQKRFSASDHTWGLVRPARPRMRSLGAAQERDKGDPWSLGWNRPSSELIGASDINADELREFVDKFEQAASHPTRDRISRSGGLRPTSRAPEGPRNFRFWH